MSALAEEKGGKSEKTPTLSWPAAVMSSIASAEAWLERPKLEAPISSKAAKDERIVACSVIFIPLLEVSLSMRHSLLGHWFQAMAT
jgi:hypothetical protein